MLCRGSSAQWVHDAVEPLGHLVATDTFGTVVADFREAKLNGRVSVELMEAKLGPAGDQLPKLLHLPFGVVIVRTAEQEQYVLAPEMEGIELVALREGATVACFVSRELAHVVRAEGIRR